MDQSMSPRCTVPKDDEDEAAEMLSRATLVAKDAL